MKCKLRACKFNNQEDCGKYQTTVTTTFLATINSNTNRANRRRTKVNPREFVKEYCIRSLVCCFSGGKDSLVAKFIRCHYAIQR